VLSTAHAWPRPRGAKRCAISAPRARHGQQGRRDGFDPVTAADRAAEAAMRAVLAERRPQDAILGEEDGAINPAPAA
jgi:fructose-1,6-bisphosphatase/inositol monophosphatase family enzyme